MSIKKKLIILIYVNEKRKRHIQSFNAGIFLTGSEKKKKVKFEKNRILMNQPFIL